MSATTAPVSVELGNARLLRLAAHLETLPRKRFGFSTWVGKSWKGAQDLSCGAPACGLGWAVVLFGEECGVELRRYGSGPAIPSPVESGPVAWDDYLAASTLMFGLSPQDTDYLFTPCEENGCGGPHCDEEGHALQICEATGCPLGKATAAQVAAHIRRFVEGRA